MAERRNDMGLQDLPFGGSTWPGQCTNVAQNIANDPATVHENNPRSTGYPLYYSINIMRCGERYFRLKIGCKTIAFSDWQLASEAIQEY